MRKVLIVYYTCVCVFTTIGEALTDATCPVKSYQRHRPSGKCFRVNEDSVSDWASAKNSCEFDSRDYNSSLIVLTDDELLTYIGSYVTPRRLYWVGFESDGSGSVFTWLDGTILATDDPNWHPGEPNNMYEKEWCGDMSYSKNNRAGFNDRICSDQLNYICELGSGYLGDPCPCLAENSECNTHIDPPTCRCQVLFEERNGHCYPTEGKVELGDQCPKGHECDHIQNAECVNDWDTTACSCKQGYKQVNNSENQWVCVEGFYAECKDKYDCGLLTDFLECSNKTCKCVDGYMFTSGSCHEADKDNLGVSCRNGDECDLIQNAECVNDTGVAACSCKDGYKKVKDSDNQWICSNGSGYLGDPCPCLAENSECNTHTDPPTCRCQVFFEERNGHCYPTDRSYIGEIVGGAFGVLFLVLIIVIVIYCLCRRRGRSYEVSSLGRGHSNGAYEMPTISTLKLESHAYETFSI